MTAEFFPTSTAAPRRTWWARAWVEAVEALALDPDALTAGRALARGGRVGGVTVAPGRVTATVYDTDPETASLLVEPLDDAEWAVFTAEIGRRAGHLAALLDGDLPRGLVVDAEDAGATLLPAAVQIDPSCTCDGWEHPCRHAAALAQRFAALVSADPWALFLLRGRSRDAVLGARVPTPAERATIADAARRARTLLDAARDEPA